MPLRDGEIVEVDVVAGDDVLLHRAGRDPHRRDAAGERLAGGLHQLGDRRVLRQAEHHGDAGIVRQPAGEQLAAAGIVLIILDVGKQQRRPVAVAEGAPRDGAEFAVPIHLGRRLRESRPPVAAARSSRANHQIASSSPYRSRRGGRTVTGIGLHKSANGFVARTAYIQNRPLPNPGPTRRAMDPRLRYARSGLP